MMWRNLASTALSMIVVLLVVAGGLIAWGKAQYSETGPLASAICLRVEPGSNFNRVSEALAADGAISSPAIFRLGAEYAGKTEALKAGSFLVPEGASMQEITDIVTRGGDSTCGNEIIYRIGVTRVSVLLRQFDPATRDVSTISEFSPDDDLVPAEYLRFRDQSGTRLKVQIIEGTTVWQVGDALDRADFLSGSVATLPPEGMLAPDTYEVAKGDERAALIADMVEAQEARLTEAWGNRADDLPYGTPQEALIMASIIQKEAAPNEHRDVASVFDNRLNQGMRLQTDPTVIYGITNGQGTLGRGLRQSELRADTTYNTYVIDGLPPTPIANPGLASIEAALNPTQTDYIFFVAKTLNPADGHVFSSTLDEHNAAVAKLRALEAAEGGQ